MLAVLALAVAPSAAEAGEPIPANVPVRDVEHRVEVSLDRTGATLHVTRALTNSNLPHARVQLPLPLPCTAVLDQFEVVERGPDGTERWAAAALLSPEQADAAHDAYFDATYELDGDHHLDSDTAMLLTRSRAWGCDASLEIYPIPPAQTRRFSYRVFVPSVYADGRYTIELPRLGGTGLTPDLEFVPTTPATDREFTTSVGGQVLTKPVTLSGDQAHTIVLSPRDPGRGRVHIVDLDLPALVAASPVAEAVLALESEPDQQPLGHLIQAQFEVPAQLAALPAVRRAVVLIDGSRSVSDSSRQDLQRFAGAYAQALVAQDAKVEVLVFDREVRRVYHDFVPARWAATDIEKLDIDARNGSEVGEAVAAARTLLADTPTTGDGVDWIIVLSDLDLRGDFDLERERELAEASAVRLHVVRPDSAQGFGPAAADEAWTMLARAAGGMAWDGTSVDFASELVRPERVWNPTLELDLADGGRQSLGVGRWLDAGSLAEWVDAAHARGPVTGAAFVGEVWGQRRAWAGSPTDTEARRLAGALASTDHEGSHGLSDAVLTAFAFHAQVVSEWSSAWVLAQFDGTAPAPMLSWGTGGCFSGSFGGSIGCGGARSHRSGIPITVDFATVAQAVLDHCQPPAGAYVFETTDLEIVAVDAKNRCIAEQTWDSDIRSSGSMGRKRVTVQHAGARVSTVEIVPS